MDLLFKNKNILDNKTHSSVGKNRLKYFGFIYYRNFYRMLLLNALFIVFCIPIITIPAATTSMLKVCMNLIKDGFYSLWTDFITEFKKSFLKSLLAGVFIAILTALIYISVRFYLSGSSSTITHIILYGLLSFIFVIACYMFIQIAMLKLSLKNIIKNSILITIISIKDYFLLLIAGVLLVLLILYFPMTIVLMLLGSFSTIALYVCIIAQATIDKYLIKYEAG